MPLSDKKCKNPRPKKVGQKPPYKLADMNGLYLYVSNTGITSWRYNFRLHEKYRTYTYGTYPEISLSEARELHRKVHKLVAEGIDPHHVRRKELLEYRNNQENTFQKLADRWLKKREKEVKPDTLRGVKNRLEKDVLPEIGDMPLKELRSGDFLIMLQKIEARGAYELRDRAKYYCNQIMDFGVATNKIERNPLRDLNKKAFVAKVVEHQLALEPKEIPELVQAIHRNDARLYKQTRLAVKLLLLTFVRPIELVTAEWNDIHENIWTVPGEKRKRERGVAKGRDLMVPLSNQALEILEVLKKINGKGKYVFVKQRRPKEHMCRDVLSDAIRSLGFKGRQTAHGFRALARTTLRERLKYYPDVIEAQLGHKPMGSLGNTYDRSQFIDDRIVMMQDWADYIDASLVGEDSCRVKVVL